jgi:hypothetical protein
VKINPLPSREYLLECFSYEDGLLIWKVRPREHFKTARGWNIFNTRDAGKPAGVLNKLGYVVVCVGYRRCYTHRVIWAMFRDVTPGLEIDHINNVKSDNRVENLREATRQENINNSPARKNNKLGVKGVCVADGKFISQLPVNGTNTHVGTFATLEEAKTAYDQAARLHHGEFFRP